MPKRIDLNAERRKRAEQQQRLQMTEETTDLYNALSGRAEGFTRSRLYLPIKIRERPSIFELQHAAVQMAERRQHFNLFLRDSVAFLRERSEWLAGRQEEDLRRLVFLYSERVTELDEQIDSITMQIYRMKGREH